MTAYNGSIGKTKDTNMIAPNIFGGISLNICLCINLLRVIQPIKTIPI